MNVLMTIAGAGLVFFGFTSGRPPWVDGAVIVIGVALLMAGLLRHALSTPAGKTGTRTGATAMAEVHKLDYVEIFRDEAGEWRWRRLNGHNHQVVATSGEGYNRLSHCYAMARKMNDGLTIVEEEK